MQPADTDLYDLAQAYGIATEFWDWQGRHTQVSEQTIVSVLGAFDVDATTPEATTAALAAHRLARWRRVLPATMVVRQGSSASFWVHVDHGQPVQVWLELEGGATRDSLRQLENWIPPVHVDGREVGEASFQLPDDLPLGYHSLHARAADRQASTGLIVTPDWLGFPGRMGDRRAWGYATQLYSVRSRGSWGVGDLADLTDLAVWSAAEQGAGFVLVNPLHAAQPVPPMEPSPYLPTTRRFVNPMYLRVERIPEFADLSDADRAEVRRLRLELQDTLKGVDRIDRDAAWAAKRAALKLVHAVPRSAGREVAYRAYRQDQGAALTDYATWCALAEVHGPDWRLWPAELRQPRSSEVAAFAREHAELVGFHCWLQWAVEEQLDATQSAASRAGMPLGVMHDLAVGVHPHGAETWSMPDLFAQQITVGAPPDAYNQTGQDWTQPPWRPDRLADLGYEPFRQVLSAVLRHAGGVRVDHIIGLFRLWWIPSGQPAKAGTYVRYDHEALVGILALEAHRADALVVGEDVGTVEPWVRRYLRERGILGTSILWFEFEYDAGGAPLRPEWWREHCLASVTTHDLPPTAGYLAGDHVRLRESLGLLTRSLEEELAADRAEQRAWLDELHSRGALAPVADVAETVAALHRYLTWTPARLISVALTDAVGDRRAQNQPGTLDEYPNWRIPLSGPDRKALLLEDVMVSERAAALAAVVGDI